MAALVDSALIIMAKVPEPGYVKTRLCPPLSHQESADLYSCMLHDKISQVISLPQIDVLVAFPDTDDPNLLHQVACGCRRITQYGPDLGARLLSCAETAIDMGYRRVLLVDSDSPTLPPSFFEKALAALDDDTERVVLGPTCDGGYYLVGMSRLCPELFRDIPWSTPRVFEVTCGRASSLNIPLATLPVWYDVDVEQDLWRLALEFTDPDAVSDAHLTASWLSEHNISAVHIQAGTRSPVST